MRFTILMGSPRENGNTAEICKPFIDELKNSNAQIKYITIADKDIKPCKGCYVCQNVDDAYGCILKDDMHNIIEDIIWADCIVFATPIYSWYCPTEMKAVLDRLYGLNKFYGNASGSLWSGKSVAIISTHGYEQAYATEPFETGIKRLCIHSKLKYLGMYTVRDTDDLASFQTDNAINRSREFALSLLTKQ